MMSREGWTRLALCFCLLDLSSFTYAADAERSRGGPPGGTVRTIAIDRNRPSTIYAGTDGGLFKSTNAGKNWESLALPLTGPPVWALILNASDPSTMHISMGALLRSTNGGASWTTVEQMEAPVRVFARDPQDPSVLYAGAIASRGVFKSADGGVSWFPVNSGLPVYAPGPDQSGSVGDVTSLAIDPSNPGTVYAAFSHGGVYMTANGGGSWRAVTSGLPSRFVSALAMDPVRPWILYAAVYCGGGPVAPGFRCEGGIFQTTDGGANWHDVSSGLQSQDVAHLVFAPNDPSILYAATAGGWVYRASGDGTSWTALHSGVYPGLAPTGVQAFAVDPGDPSIFYVGTFGGGIYKSSDAGATWTSSSSGLSAAATTTIALSDASVVFAGTSGGGVFRSEDGGASWKTASSGLTNTFILALVIHPAVRSTLYAAAGSRVFRTTDGGASWTAAHAGLPETGTGSLAVHPTDPSTVFAGYPYGDRAGMFKSTDGGSSWRAIDLSNSRNNFNVAVWSLKVVPGNPWRLFAMTTAGLLRSSDAGESWTAVSIAEGKVHDVYDLAFAPSNPLNLYVLAAEPCGWCAEQPSLFKSTDGGESWVEVNVVPWEVGRIVVDRLDPSVLYSGHVGILKSTDEGMTWNPAGLKNTIISVLAQDSNSAVLYAATHRGVFRSTDSAASWTPTGTEFATPAAAAAGRSR